VAAVQILVDTDVLIDYFNAGDHSQRLDSPGTRVYYSIVTQQELLAKRGLSAAERRAIRIALGRFRLVPLSAPLPTATRFCAASTRASRRRTRWSQRRRSSSGFHS